MQKNIIYNELVRQYQEGNIADDTVNKKIDFLLVSLSVLIGYLFTIDKFLDIFIKGNILIRHFFIAGFLLLVISLFYTIKSFLLTKFKRGIKINSIERIKKSHSKIDELTIINYSLKEAIKYNYEKQQRKNGYFLKGLVFLFLSVIFFIISKIIYSL